MLSMHLQSLKLMCPTAKEKIYKKQYILTFWVKVEQNVLSYPLHHVTYSPAKFEVASSNALDWDTFTRLHTKYINWPLTKVIRNVAQLLSWACDLMHLQGWSCRVKQFRGRCNLEKIYFLAFDLVLGVKVKVIRNCFQLPSTLCDLCTCKVISCDVQCFSWRCIYKKLFILTFDLDL